VTGASSSGGTMNGGGGSVAYTLNLPKSTVWSSADLALCDYNALTTWPSAGLVFTNWASTGAKSIAVCSTAAVDGNTAAADYTDTVNVTVTY
jgi:spore coat protein U-like protein